MDVLNQAKFWPVQKHTARHSVDVCTRDGGGIGIGIPNRNVPSTLTSSRYKSIAISNGQLKDSGDP